MQAGNVGCFYTDGNSTIYNHKSWKMTFIICVQLYVGALLELN